MNSYVESVGSLEVILWNEFYFVYYLFYFYFFADILFLLCDSTLSIGMLCCIPENVMKTALFFLWVFLSCHTYTFRENFLTAIYLPHGQLWAIIQGKASWPTLGHHRGDSLTHPMLVTAFCLFSLEDHWNCLRPPCSKQAQYLNI